MAIDGGPLTFGQGAMLSLLLGMMFVFLLERFRIELVALGGLALAFVLGLVPAAGVFEGFANPAVITVAEILLIIQALSRSHVVERLAAATMRLVRGERAALAFLCGTAAALSVFMNNIGALGLIVPVAVSLGSQLGIPIFRLLMPLSFATLLGGLCSLIGTPANLVVSQAAFDGLGRPFAFFELAWVGVPTALAGLGLLIVWAPRSFSLWQGNRAGRTGMEHRRLVTEVRLPAASPFTDGPVSYLEAALSANVISLVRNGQHVFGRPAEQIARGGDLLVLEVPTAILEDAADAGIVEPAIAPKGDMSTVDVVLMPQSVFVGSRVATLDPLFQRGITVTGVVPQRHRVEGRLGDLQLAIGDILVLQGPEEAIEDVLDELDLLRLSSRGKAIPRRHAYTAITLFAVGVVVAAAGLLPPAVCFGAVVFAMALTGALSLREALQGLNWPMLIMLAAMIPLGTAMETTGTAFVLSRALLGFVDLQQPVAIVAAVLLIAVALTPFLNNVSTAVVLSPIVIEIAQTAGMPADPLLVAVAVGASLDFLTPFGHHNNTLVMGMAGYRFLDFPRLGGPLLVVTLAVALLAIWAVWL